MCSMVNVRHSSPPSSCSILILHSSISHFGVLVAPQMPMELQPCSQWKSISLAVSIIYDFRLAFLHSLKSTLPLLLFLPQLLNKYQLQGGVLPRPLIFLRYGQRIKIVYIQGILNLLFERGIRAFLWINHTWILLA